MKSSDYTTWQLARLADCASPDAADGIGFESTEPANGSPGAQFLRSVADDVEERISDNEGVVYRDYHDDASEIADSAVPVYTAEKWRTFVDLAAWDEDASELGAETSDMSKAAAVCLYLIADRLANALFEAAGEESDDAEEAV